MLISVPVVLTAEPIDWLK